MAKTRLGFDIGSGSLKIAVLRGGELRVEENRLPENLVDESGAILPHAFAEYLRRLRKELSLPRGASSLVLPPSQAICRLVTMPEMTAEQLMMNLPYEFSDFIRGEPDQYFCDYAVCAPAGEDGEHAVAMMAAVAAKSRLASYVQAFAQAGVKLTGIIPQEMALISVAKSRPAGPEEYFFVDLGHQYTRIFAVWRDRVRATRQIAVGGRSFQLALADELGVDAFLAGSYLLSDYRGAQSSRVVAELCEGVAVEILKVLNFYQFTYRDSGLDGIYLVGGGAALPPLRTAIREAVGLPLLDPAELLPGAGERAAAGIFAAGAAMGGK